MGDMIKLTGLWKQESKAGNPYLSGLVSPTSRLLVMPNAHKKDAREPDYIAFLAPGKDASEEQPAKKQEAGQFDF
jgi:hypothetical protein